MSSIGNAAPTSNRMRPCGWRRRPVERFDVNALQMEMRLHRLVSRGGHRAAVNDVFRAGDGSGARRGEKGNELRYFPPLGRASDRDAAERRISQYRLDPWAEYGRS